MFEDIPTIKNLYKKDNLDPILPPDTRFINLKQDLGPSARYQEIQRTDDLF